MILQTSNGGHVGDASETSGMLMQSKQDSLGLCTVCMFYSNTGALYLGNPRDQLKRVEIPGLTKDAVASAENASASPEALAVQLLLVLFTEDELAHGNCTKPRKSGIVLLDPCRLRAKRGYLTTIHW